MDPLYPTLKAVPIYVYPLPQPTPGSGWQYLYTPDENTV
jgi:hypothetical protein